MADENDFPHVDPTLRTRDLDALKKLIEARLDGYDKAIVVLQTSVNRSPTAGEINLDLSNFKDLATEKFKGVTDSIAQRDVRLAQAEQAAKDAVTVAFTGGEKATSAALQAAKEAVGAQSDSVDKAITKAEAATTKLLDALVAQIAVSAKGLDDKISDVKDSLNKLETRITTIESRGVVVRETQTQNNWTTSAALVVIGLLISLGLFALAIVEVTRPLSIAP